MALVWDRGRNGYQQEFAVSGQSIVAQSRVASNAGESSEVSLLNLNLQELVTATLQ